MDCLSSLVTCASPPGIAIRIKRCSQNKQINIIKSSMFSDEMHNSWVKITKEKPI